MGGNVVFVGVAADHRRHEPRGGVSESAFHPHGKPHTYGSTSTGSLDTFGLSRGNLSSSPDRIRRSDNGAILNDVPEDQIMMEFPTTEPSSTPRYAGSAPLNGDEDEEELEEAEWELDEELEEHGLYRGSYRRVVLLYTLVPLTSILFFVLLAALPSLLYSNGQPSPYPSVPYLPHPLPELLISSALFSLGHLLRGPIFAILTGISSLPALEVLATATHSFITLTLQLSALPLLLIAQHAPTRPTTRHASFHRVWWLGLGCAAAEALLAIHQGFAARALYRDVLVTVRRTDNDANNNSHSDFGDVDAEAHRGSSKAETRALTPMGAGSGSNSRSPPATIKMGTGDRATSLPGILQQQSAVELFEREVEDDVYDRRRSQPFSEEDEEAGERQPLLPKNGSDDGKNGGEEGEGNTLRMQVEDELEELLAIRAREDLENAYGVAIIRINALLLSIGLTLLLSQAYLRSTISTLSPLSPLPLGQQLLPSVPHHPHPKIHARSNTPLLILIPICWAIHASLSLLHTPLLLPRIGVPAVVYAAALVSLGAFFAGLAFWEGLS
ncbi:hypothetical protein DXG03_004403 [Asterophora parasitica]|uniref:Uncharacterized protein n=1 Tax=Asterophora parasitica TaxID=117018 RepID=A0A9P7KBD6_9AGAR|nr:hypothetical protein DXG03_004403 [Asterophora parasitica]